MPDKIMEKYGTVPMWTLYNRELPFGFKRFLALFNNTGPRALQDLVDFNKKHAELEFPYNQPSQSSFESALEDNMSDGEHVSGLRHLRQSFRDVIRDQRVGQGRLPDFALSLPYRYYKTVTSQLRGSSSLAI